MIINFKLFEETSGPKYWLVRKDDDLFELRLHKIGASEDIIKYYLRLKRKFDFHVPQDDFIQVGKRSENDWGFNTILSNSYRKQNFEFMGKIDELSDEDIENYEIAKNAKKYNL